MSYPSSSSSYRKTAAIQGTTAVRGLSSASTSFSSSVSNSSGGGKQHTTTTTATYEQVKALSREALLPDKVSWNSETSYRGNSYRLLQHQNGIIGYLHMRLIEGQNLQLKQQQQQQQRKQPPVSAYALIHLSHTKNLSDTYDPLEEDWNASTAPDNTTTNTATTSVETFRSSTVWDCTNPVWPVSSYYASSAEGSSTTTTTLDSTTQNNSHSSSNRPTSSFRIPLRKGTIPEGSEVLLNIHMQHNPHSEFSTSSSSGGAFGIFNIFQTNDNLSLGRAAINVTKLLMGEEAILDVWVQLTDARSSTGSCILSSAAKSSGIGVEGDHQQDTATKKLSSSKVIPSGTNSYGKVRILLSYEPEGLRPQLNDYVTFEAFARHPNNLIISPITQPVKVVATRGEYLLLQFYYYSTSPNSSIAIRRKEIPENRNEGRVRVHRNTVFVIERISFVDGVMDTLLQPVDIVTQLPVVQEVGKVLRPVTNVVTDLTMPAILSGKMFLAITKTAASAGITGVLTTVKVLAMATTAAANSKRD
jgi:hypothetical protein